MKTYTIRAETVFSAVKRQWKRFLAIVLAFAVLGAAGGWLYAGRGSSETGGGGADPLPKVNLGSIARTPVYYSDCLQMIIDAYDQLEPYINGVISAGNPAAAAKTPLERLAAVNIEKREFQQNALIPLQDALAENGALYVPEEFMESLAGQYESRLSSIEFDLLAAETAAETVRQMGAPNSENSSITGSYASLIGQAANYGELLKSRAILEKSLGLLRDEPERVRSESRRVEQALNEAAAELNALLEEASQAAGEVGKAADVVITRQLNNKSSYEIVAKHTYSAAPRAEAFAAIELFCVLAGICAGGFLTVCREAKEEKKAVEKSA